MKKLLMTMVVVLSALVLPGFVNAEAILHNQAFDIEEAKIENNELVFTLKTNRDIDLSKKENPFSLSFGVYTVDDIEGESGYFTLKKLNVLDKKTGEYNLASGFVKAGSILKFVNDTGARFDKARNENYYFALKVNIENYKSEIWIDITSNNEINNVGENLHSLVESEYIEFIQTESEMGYTVFNFKFLKDIDFTKGTIEVLDYLCEEEKCKTGKYVEVKREDTLTPWLEEGEINGNVVKANAYGGISYRTRRGNECDDEGNLLSNAFMFRIVEGSGYGEEILVWSDGDNYYVANIKKITPNGVVEDKDDKEENKGENNKEEAKDVVSTIPADKKASKGALEEAKANGTKVTYESKTDGKVDYSWTFDGSKMESTDYDIDLNLTIGKSTNQETIEKLLDSNVSSLVLQFAYHGELPKGTSVKLNVSNKYSKGDKLTLYYYNEETKKLEEVAKGLEVTDGYVTLALEHCSEYVLVKEVITVDEEVPGTLDNNAIYIALALIATISIFAIVKKFSKEV